MKVNKAWNAVALYYESISMFFADLCGIILSVSIVVVGLRKLGSMLFPSRMPKLPKPISRRVYRIMTLAFGALSIAFFVLIVRQRQFILSHDFSQEEAAWSEYLYFDMGKYEIGALLSLEGFVFSASGLWRKVKEQLQAGKELQGGEDEHLCREDVR